METLCNTPKSCMSCELNGTAPKFIQSQASPADILFVVDSPNYYTAMEKKLLIYDDPGMRAVEHIFHTELEAYKKSYRKRYEEPLKLVVKRDYAYTVSCHLNADSPKTFINDKKKPNAKAIQKCRGILMATIDKFRPKVIVPVGAAATKALNIHFKKFRSIVARTNMVKINDSVYTVIPVEDGPKLSIYDEHFTIARYAIQTAIEHIVQYGNPIKREIDVSRYHFPKTPDEVRDLCRNVIIPACSGENKTFLGVDIETNTRYPEEKTAKMTMISFSWGEGESCAIWFDSKHTTYDFREVIPYIQEVLACDARKVFHNGSFDYKFLHYIYKFVIKNLCWDTMLSEHILDENQKGFYNLEFLAGKYFAVFENYKKLVLKKISVKDQVPIQVKKSSDSEEEEQSVTSIQSSHSVIDNQEYFRRLQEYDEALEEYDKKKAEHKVKMSVYKQEYALWSHKYNECLKAKLKGLTKEEAQLIKDMRAEAKACRPEKPEKLENKKPEKPSIIEENADGSEANFEDYDPDDLALYCAMDSDVTRRICIRQKDMISEDDSRMLRIIAFQQIPGLKALADMEYVGVNTDQKYLDKIESELGYDYSKLHADLLTMTNRPDFKPNSPSQIGQVLVSGYGASVSEEFLTKTGQVKTDKESLLLLAKKFEESNTQNDREALRFIEALLNFRGVSKALKTTISNFREFTKLDGRLRTSYRQNGTATGRLSSGSPNLQNIALMGGGKNLKKFMIPDQEDHVMCNVDIKAAEVKCLLAYALEKSLIAAIEQGLDFHCTTASEVWFEKKGQEYGSVKEFYEALFEAHNAVEPTEKQKQLCKLRKITKAITFGLIYGITKFGLSRDLKCTEDEAQSYIDTFFKKYPAIKKYMTDTEIELYNKKEVQSLTYRKRRFPRYELDRFRCYRQAINFKVQNIASDLVVRIIGEMHKTIGPELGGRMALTVHDSIVMSIPKRSLPKLEAYCDRMIVQDVKEKYGWMRLKFEYDIEVGPNYGEQYKLTDDLIAEYTEAL